MNEPGAAERRHAGAPAARLGRRDVSSEQVVLLDVRWDVCERAELLGPRGMCSLDALHLASALTLAGDLEEIVTYDVRLRDAAPAVGLAVIAPV